MSWKVAGVEVDRICGSAADAGFGWTICTLQDVDGDGVEEVALGAYGYDDVSLGSDVGKVIVISGSSHSVLNELIGEMRNSRFGATCAAISDIDHDGIGDLLIGAPGFDDYNGAGAAYVYSTKSGVLLRSYYGGTWDALGYNVASVGDVDSDGRSDYSVHASLLNDNGRLLIYTASTGAELFRWEGANNDAALGGATEDLGDFDGDGHDDILTNSFPTNTPGVVYCYSGSTGKVLFELKGERKLDRFGGGIKVLGDMNRDSYPEILVAASQDDRDGYLAGAAYVISTRTQRPLYRFFPGFKNATLGWQIGGGDDLNRDGIPDGVISVLYGPKIGHSYQPEWIFAFAGNDLFLQAVETTVATGASVTLETRGGETGALTMLVFKEISGTSMFVPLAIDALDANGESAFVSDVPDSASGLEFTLRAYAQKHAGGRGIIDSSDEVVTVE